MAMAGAATEMPEVADAKTGLQNVKEGKDAGYLVTENSATGTHYDPNFPDDVYPTQEELDTLPRHPDSLPLDVFLIALVELCERLSYYGCSAVYTNFIQQPLPLGSTTGKLVAPDQRIPGALGRGQRASTGLTTFNSFWNYVTPLVGGYIADARFGRYKTILFGIFIAIIGHIILIIAALPPVLKDPDGAMGCFAVALVVIGCGTGCFKPNISPMIAEQYKRKHVVVRTRKNGSKYLVDPSMTIARIFLYFYALINVGSIVGQVSMVYAERRVGFWLAYTIPTCVFCISPTVMILARHRYNNTPPKGSVLGKALRVTGYALKGEISWNPITTVKNLRKEEIWHKAQPSNIVNPNSKVTWDDDWVWQVRRGLSACVVFLPFPIFWIAYNQILNNLLSQAATMELHGVPNDLLQNLNPLAIIILIPIMDFIVYPFFRKINFRHSPLRRMTWGFYAGTLAMVSAAIVQHYIYKLGPCGNYMNTCDEPAPVNVWAQTPSYVLIGLSEIFASITGLEYAFTKAPVNMRSFVTAIWLFMTAIGNAITQAFVALSEDPLLVVNYSVVAGLAFVTGTLFWLSFRKLDRKEEEMNALDQHAGDPLSAREEYSQHLPPATHHHDGTTTASSSAGADPEK